MLMTLQNTFKVAVFVRWALPSRLPAADRGLIATGFVGTAIGSRLLVKYPKAPSAGVQGLLTLVARHPAGGGI